MSLLNPGLRKPNVKHSYKLAWLKDSYLWLNNSYCHGTRKPLTQSQVKGSQVDSNVKNHSMLKMQRAVAGLSWPGWEWRNDKGAAWVGQKKRAIKVMAGTLEWELLRKREFSWVFKKNLKPNKYYFVPARMTEYCPIVMVVLLSLCHPPPLVLTPQTQPKWEAEWASAERVAVYACCCSVLLNLFI